MTQSYEVITLLNDYAVNGEGSIYQIQTLCTPSDFCNLPTHLKLKLICGSTHITTLLPVKTQNLFSTEIQTNILNVTAREGGKKQSTARVTVCRKKKNS